MRAKTPRLAIRVLLGLLLVAGASLHARATDVGGAISTNSTWTTAASPYIVTATVTVNAGVTLTVQAGVTVKFNTGTGLTVNGTLAASGTTAQHVLFTSNAATPAPGNWTTITLNAGSQASVLSYCDIEYGGASN